MPHPQSFSHNRQGLGGPPCCPKWVNMRNPRCEQMFSALLPTSDVFQQRSSWATSITARVVSHPAEGKAPRPLHSPRVVFYELARFRAAGQKASLGTPQAGARPMSPGANYECWSEAATPKTSLKFFISRNAPEKSCLLLKAWRTAMQRQPAVVAAFRPADESSKTRVSFALTRNRESASR